MTLEGWSADIARPVMAVLPSAWLFFVLFVLIATFVIVNLFVAVIVNSISDARADDAATGGANRDAVRRELDALREEYSLLKHEALARRR